MHPPKKQVIVKFVLLVALLVAYFAYLSWEYGAETGATVTALTWSFFVLCTPIADGGFLIDFPMRLLFKLRMWMSEIIVWAIAISLNAYLIATGSDAYQKTPLTDIFEKILTTPWPYWGIIFLSCAGTFLSIVFGDEMMDVLHHKDRVKHQTHGFLFEVILYVAGFALIVAAYYHLAGSLGVQKILENN